MDSLKQVTTNHIAPGESTTLLKLMSRKYFVDVRSGAAVTEHWLWWIQASPTAWCCLPATRSGVKRELMQCNERSWPEQARALDGSIALTAPNYDRPISRPPYPKLDPLAAAANDPRLSLVERAGDRPMGVEDGWALNKHIRRCAAGASARGFH